MKIDATDIPQFSIPPISNEFPTHDLRRTINRLQVCCMSADSQTNCAPCWEGEEEENKNLEDLCDWTWAGTQSPSVLTTSTALEGSLSTRELVARHADLISFVDSNLMRDVFERKSVGILLLRNGMQADIVLVR